MLGFHDSATLCCVCALPENDWVSVESEALLRKEMLPEEVPAVGGVKVTVYFVF